MDRDTVDVYEQRADEWIGRRAPVDLGRVRSFAERATGGAPGRWHRPVADLGCGPGWYTGPLGTPAVAVDAAWAMVARTRAAAPAAWAVQADLEALPFRSGALGGALALRSYVHVERSAMPLALADLHRSLEPGAPVELVLFEGDAEHVEWPGDDFPGRRFSLWDEERLVDVLTGGGFDEPTVEPRTVAHGKHLVVRTRRARSLADTVGPGMRILVCGLNPSLYAADAGVAFARPGNRFWPAALAAGLVARDRDPRHALQHHGVGMTDLVKRATVAAADLDDTEYAAGVARVARLCAWLRPGVVCVVGLAGWRAAVDRRAGAGPQARALGPTPVYVMPSTSGLNAHARLDDLTDHLRAAAALADRR